MGGLWARIGRSSKAAVLLAAALVGGAAAVAVAAIPDSSGQIHACYSTSTANGEPSTGSANLTIIDPSGQSCAANQRELDWNQAGPTGPQGPTGQSGSQGQAGQQGPQGPAITVLGGHTLTLAGGQVLTVGGNPNGITIESPVPNLNHTLGLVTLHGPGGATNVQLSFKIAAFNLLNSRVSSFGGGGGAGKVSVHEITITKPVDSASPKLSIACASGKHFPSATIVLHRAGTSYVTYTLTNVAISSYQISSGGDRPSESMSLNFTKIQVHYGQQK